MNLDTIGQFTWLWGTEFFIETEKGNFIWFDPDYGGDNTLRRTENTLAKHLKKCGIPYGRDKGTHSIRAYCGKEVVIL